MDFKEIYDKLTEKAESDENFKEDVLKDAKKALKEKLDVDFEEGVNVKVVESTPDHLHFVLPVVDKDKLSKVTGGMDSSDDSGLEPGMFGPHDYRPGNPNMKGRAPFCESLVTLRCNDCHHTWRGYASRSKRCWRCGSTNISKPARCQIL